MRKFLDDFVNKIIYGDALKALREIPDECVDTIITSPPYWGLRDYGEETKTIWGEDEGCEHKWKKIIEKKHSGSTKSLLHREKRYKTEWKQASDFCWKCGAWKGQLGLEPTLDLYLNHLLQITNELKRVLKPAGVMFWNHGDSYGGPQGKFARWPDQKLKIGENIPEHKKPKQFAKCLLGQNYRLAIKMVDEQNWIWRNTIIWWKPNCMPSSAKDRFTVDYEPVFFFTKSKKYWFEPQFESFESNKYDLKRMANARTEYGGKWAQESGGAIKTQRAFVAGGSLGRNKRCVWKINTHPFPEAHFAVFPETLVETPIKAGCPEMICRKCGRPREKIFKPSEEYRKLLGRSWTPEQDKDKSVRAKRGMLKNAKSVSVTADYRVVGYTDCGCNAGWEPGIVLDPFVGAGTSCVVAKKLKRRWIGIDISKEYCRMARERIKNIPSPLF